MFYSARLWPRALREHLVALQYGRAADSYGWVERSAAYVAAQAGTVVASAEKSPVVRAFSSHFSKIGVGAIVFSSSLL